jgi:tetratricopeptide (TPR) repeat protein
MGTEERTTENGQTANPSDQRREATAGAARSAVGRWLLVGAGLVALIGLGMWGLRAWKTAEARAALAALQPVAATVPAEQAERRAAMEVADGLLRDFPQSPEALYVRGTLLVRHGFNQEAAKTWQACLKLAPDLAPAYEFLGIEACRRGANEEAVTFLRKAVQLDPQSSAAGLYLGEALNNLGRMREAIPVLEQFLQVAPQAAEPHFQLGQAYFYLQEFKRAKACHLAALRADPGFAQACFGVAQACERLGETEQAHIYRAKHVAMIAQGRQADQRRVRSGRSATEAREALANAYMTAAKIYIAQGQTQVAQELLRKAAAADPQAARSGAAGGQR